MRYTINGKLANEPARVVLTIERRDEWQGFSTYLQPFNSDVCNAYERLIVYGSSLHFITPCSYDVNVVRLKGNNYHWSSGNADSAYKWFRKRRAEFGLFCASVTIDSVARVITITVNSDAEVVEEDQAGSVVIEA